MVDWEESELNDVLREQIQLNTKEVVVNVDNDHMKASIVLNGIGSDPTYTYEEIADKLSQAVRTGINEARIREVILNKLYDIEIVVAEGKSAVNGTDGFITTSSLIQSMKEIISLH